MGDDYYGFEGRGTLTIGKDLLILSPYGKVSKESEVSGWEMCLFSCKEKRG